MNNYPFFFVIGKQPEKMPLTAKGQTKSYADSAQSPTFPAHELWVPTAWR